MIVGDMASTKKSVLNIASLAKSDAVTNSASVDDFVTRFCFVNLASTAL